MSLIKRFQQRASSRHILLTRKKRMRTCVVEITHNRNWLLMDLTPSNAKAIKTITSWKYYVDIVILLLLILLLTFSFV